MSHTETSKVHILKILLLEDDPLLSEIITEHLRYYRYSVVQVYSGLEAETLVCTHKFDLLLLDVNVPHLNGFEFLKYLRDTGDKTPAIFITSMSSASDLLKGFEVGANDYIKKPFEIVELKARIDNIMRHFKLDDAQLYTISDTIFFDEVKRLLDVKGLQIHLTKKESEFLAYLLVHRGRVLSTDELMSNVWSYNTSPTSATIRSYVKILRRYLAEEYITTIRGIGYVFN